MEIIGFFSSFKKGNEVVEKLKQAGFKAVLDLNDHYIDRNVQTNLPGTETGPSLSALVLNSGDPTIDRSKAPLAAASPMVSGMAGFEEIADVNCVVKVTCEESDENKVKKMLTDLGGDLYNPNTEPPKGLANVSTDNVDVRDFDIGVYNTQSINK